MKKIGHMALLASALMVLSPVAEAGFQWKPGAKQQPAPTQAPAAPAAASAEDMMTPAPLTPVMKEAIAKTPSLESAGAHVKPPIPAGDYEAVESFGRDVNIVIALRQIVPAHYQFSFGPDVDLKQGLSWQGDGQPWPQFLQTVLEPVGLRVYVKNKVVLITGVGAPALAAAPVTPPAPPAPKPPAMKTIVAIPPEKQTEKQTERQTEKPAATPPAAYKKPAAIVWDESRSAPLPIVKAKPAPEAVPPAAVSEVAPPPALPPIVSPAPMASVTTKTEDDKVLPPKVSKRVPLMSMRDEDVPPAATPAPIAITKKSAPVPVMPIAVPPPITQEIEVAAPKPPPVAKPSSTTWTAPQGATLRDVLKNWSDQNAIRLFWGIDYDYRLSRDIQINGSFETAVQGLLDHFAGTYPRPVGQLYSGKAAEKVLVIRSPDLLG